MADANPSKSSEVNADESRKDEEVKPKSKKAAPKPVIEVTSKAAIKPDPEGLRFELLQEGEPGNPAYRKYQLPDGTVKEQR